jgi:hypothetical protein
MAREQIASTPLARLQVGDEVKIPGGKTLTLDESHINENRQQLMPAGSPLPMTVARQDGKWKVDASPIIASRKAAAKARAQQGQP